MIAKALVRYGQEYFELNYDEWLRHRSKLKKYEIWFATALTLFGVTLALAYLEFWPLGASIAACGIYEFILAVTSKRRWVKARLATARDDKSVEFEFTTESIVTSSKNGTANLKYSLFIEFKEGTRGFFLIPDNGMSIFVPQACVEPSDAYCELIEFLYSTINTGDLLINRSPFFGNPWK